MFGAVQPKTPEAVLAGLNQFGAAVGARKIMTWEFNHAKDAIESGVYVTLYNKEREHECSRLGRFSRCFCNHLYSKHALKRLKNHRFGKNPCSEEGCKCENFLFMFRRPEEIGQYHLTRRKGFDVNDWRPLCRCKHPHALHSADKRRCAECACSKFISDFACLSCDGKWEEHEVRYETEEDRKEGGLSVGDQFYPLSDVPDIQKEFKKQMAKEKEKARLNKEEVATPGEPSSDQPDTPSTEVVQLSDALGTVALNNDDLTLPARDKPEKSVRLMRENGMLRKY